MQKGKWTPKNIYTNKNTYRIMINSKIIYYRFILGADNFIENKNKFVLHKETFQSDPILLASHGVLYAGEWIRLSTQNSNHIQRILDNGKIILDKSNLCYPLECSIWSHWCSTKPMQKEYKTFLMFLK